MAKRIQPPVIEVTTCRCGANINMVPMRNSTLVLPVDTGKNPDGDLLIVGQRGGSTVRLIRPYEHKSTDPDLRRLGHWNRCPLPIWSSIRRSLRLNGPVKRDRSGPCARCRRPHAWHYEGPPASPLCDSCRVERGMIILGEPGIGVLK